MRPWVPWPESPPERPVESPETRVWSGSWAWAWSWRLSGFVALVDRSVEPAPDPLRPWVPVEVRWAASTTRGESPDPVASDALPPDPAPVEEPVVAARAAAVTADAVGR